jgi:hypothetical protein
MKNQTKSEHGYIIKELQTAIKSLHKCQSNWIESFHVKETFQGQTIWEGIVEVFQLVNHPTAKKCYAWSHMVDKPGKRKFVAVLHEGPVDSPQKAVQAVIISEFKNRSK